MIIRNAWICQLDAQDNVRPIFGDLEIANGKIKTIIVRPANRFVHLQSKQEIDAHGRVLTTPMVNFHEHIYSRLAKGLPISGPMTNFVEILESLWWKLDRLLDLPMVEASAQMAAIECLQQGVTYLFDHHASPSAVSGSLATIARVLQSFNLRSVMAFEVSDRNGQEISRASIEENLDFIQNHTNADTKGMMGLHALFTISDQTLRTIAEQIANQNIGIHIHVAEDRADVELNREKFQKSLAERLNEFNLLNDQSLLIHGVHLTDDDLKIIARSGFALAFNPDSNLNNAVGLPHYASLPEQIPILMGTDGMHANVGRSLKQIFLLYRHQGNSFEQSFAFVQKIYKDQLQFVRRYFADFPRLQSGDRADFVIWEYQPPTPLTSENFFGHYLYGLLESSPYSVFQAGQQLLHQQQILIQDRHSIFENIQQQGHRLFEIFKNAD